MFHTFYESSILITTEKKTFCIKNNCSSLIQHVINKDLEQTVCKAAVKSVLDQTMIATTSMGHVFPGVLMDIKEKDAKVVSEVYILNLDISLSEKNTF